MPSVPNTALGRFVLVDQAAGVASFRAPGASLPRSRAPRPTLELREDGSATRGVPGPADARIHVTGRWEERPDGALSLRWDDGSEEAVVEIVASSPEVLELRVLSGSLDAPPGDPGG